MNHRKYRAFALGMALLLTGQLLTGCGGKTAAENKPQDEKTENTENTENAADPGSSEQSEAAQVTESSETEMTEEIREEDYIAPHLTRDQFPKMDGSTSLAPLAEAVAGLLLGESREEVSELVDFHKTTQSYRNLMNGDCSIIFASEPNAAVFEEMEETSFDYEIEPISTEGLVFVVNENNPVDSLTTEEIRKIYSGQITNWKEVGGEDLPIAAFQRNAGAGSQALMEKLVMTDRPLMDAPETYMISSMGELMSAVKSYDNSANAIGYSVYYYANDMKMAEGLKIIAVDGVVPEPKTIRESTYPFTNAYYCAIPGNAGEDSPARIIYDWIATEDGQALVAREGYVSILPIDDAKIQTAYSFYQPAVKKEPKFTRLQEGFIPDLKASGSYGRIFPFIAGNHYNAYSLNGHSYGVADALGRIVADATYTEAEALCDINYSAGTHTMLPVWKLGRTVSEGKAQDDDDPWLDGRTYYAVASADGSFVTECKYETVIGMEVGVLVAEEYNSTAFTMYDFSGKILFTEKDVKIPGQVVAGSFYSSYGDGLFAIANTDDEYYYVDSSGQKVLGPYDYAGRFYEGIASVRNGEIFRLIDTKGQAILPAVELYSGTEYMVRGEHIVCSAPDSTRVYDRKGKELFCINHGGQTDVRGNLLLLTDSKNEYDKGTVFDMEKGSELDHFDYRKDSFTEKSGIRYRFENGSTIITNHMTGALKKLRGEYSVSDLVVVGGDLESDGSAYLRAYHYDEAEGRSDVVFLRNDTLKPVFEGADSVNVRYDNITGEKLYAAWYGKICRIYAEDLTEKGAYASDPTVMGGYVRVADEKGCSIYDPQGKEFFYYSLAASYDD